MTHLIDATEMYLRTVWELEEEHVVPIRARLVERLGLSAPAVSETVARLEQEGLLEVAPDRTLRLTDAGRQIAVSVMRKHRLAERLLTDVIGLEWEQVHREACRWEHVISDAVERRLIDLLDHPDTCPHGNPIPGIAAAGDRPTLVTLAEAAKIGAEATVRRISEKLQSDVAAMRLLREHGLGPGTTVRLELEGGAVAAQIASDWVTLPDDIAELVYVDATGL
jgi:DtxR family transcriptional regulator, Mn-dependent transcriptional regulator